MIKTYQEKLNAINEQMKQLKEAKRSLINEVEQAGFMIEKDTIKTTEQTIGLFWNLIYYNTYVSEKGPLYDRGAGAISITEEEFNAIKDSLEDIEANEDELAYLLLDKIPVEEYFLEGRITRGEVTITDNSIKWEVLKGARYQGDIDKGSVIEIRKSSTAEIGKTKTTYETDAW